MNLKIMRYEQTVRNTARAPSLREIFKQYFRCHRQSCGKLHDVLKRDIAFAPFYSPDVITVKARSLSELLLRQAPFKAKRPYGGAESRFDRKRGHLSSCRDDHYESTHDEWYIALDTHQRNRRGHDQSTACHYNSALLGAQSDAALVPSPWIGRDQDHSSGGPRVVRVMETEIEPRRSKIWHVRLLNVRK